MSQKQIGIRATYMRGGTSKGVFFTPDDLPASVRDDPKTCDRLLLRVIGSPDPYGQQIDGMGGGTSSTSKVVFVSKSTRPDTDVDYRFGQVAIGAPVIDWSGNCGNLSAAVGPFAIARGLVQPPRNGVFTVRIWQANLGKRILAHVPVQDDEVVELGDFELDGVTFPAAEVVLEFLDPGADDDGGAAMFPTGKRLDVLRVPEVGSIEATLINAGNPTIFIEASSLGLTGTELQSHVNGNAQLLARILSMGKLHHAMTGTGAVAMAVAAAIPGTLVSRALGSPRAQLRCGHPSGSLAVGAEARETDGEWSVTKAVVSRSARRLMDGQVFVPLA